MNDPAATNHQGPEPTDLEGASAPPAILVVPVRQGRTTLDVLVPVLVVMLVCGTLLAIRFGLNDWQGLFPESHNRLVRTPTRPSVPAVEEPATPLNVTVAPVPGLTERAPEGPALPESTDEAPPPALALEKAEELPPIDGPVEGKRSGETAVAEVPPPARPEPGEQPIPANPGALAMAPEAATDTQSALDEIAREAERKKAEKAEMENLRKQAEANAPPPRARQRQGLPELFDLFGGRIRQLDEREVQAMMRQFEALDRQMAVEMERMRREMFDDQTRRRMAPRGQVFRIQPPPGPA